MSDCTPNTLAALRSLALEGYVADADAEILADAYRFLRRVEHRLQIVRDLQTHDLPAGRHARTTLARSLELPDADALTAEYDRTTGLVRSIHERLFYRPLLESFAGRRGASGHGTDRPATEELLGGLGFAEPARSYDVLGRLVDPTRRIGKVLGHLFPVMAPALALSPTPDAALVRLERIAEAVEQSVRTRPSATPHDRPGRGPPPRPRRAGQLVRHRPAGGRSSRIQGLSDTLLGRDRCRRRPRRRRRARTAGREFTPRESGEALSAVRPCRSARRSRPPSRRRICRSP